MNARLFPWLALALGAALAGGCGKIDPITQPAPQGGSADFSRYVATGTSITAGTESGGLVETHQRQSYAYLFARQAGSANFTIPSVSADGFPPLLQIRSLSPLLVDTLGRTRGTFTNYGQATAYNNMGVPGSILFDLADSSSYYNPLNEDRTNTFNEIVRHRGTILEQVASLQPTFMSIEYGSNEVLGPATDGSGTPIVSSGNFDALLAFRLSQVHGALPQTKLALFTVPDVTTIPFFTTFPPFTVNTQTGQPIALIGPNGPMSPGDHVLLTAAGLIAAGNGIPVNGYNYVNPAQPGNGNPLPDQVVLDAGETASIEATVDAYNTSIRSQAATYGAAVVDLNGLLKQASTTGVRFQGTIYTTKYITGGLISLDGVHPTDLAHGFIANLMIDAVNAQFGAHIPEVNLSGSATISASRLVPVSRDGKVYPQIEGLQKLCPLRFVPMPVTASLVRRR